MTKLKALIFDVDGTMADTEQYHLLAYNKAFQENSLDWHWDDNTYNELLSISGGKERVKFYIDNYDIQLSEYTDIPLLIGDIHERKTFWYLYEIKKGTIKLRLGVENLIKEARLDGILLGIATTTSLINVHHLLISTLGEESLEWFDVIAAGNIVAKKKPAGDIYQYVLEKMGVKAVEALALEDSENGILSSTAAKIKTIITTNDYTIDHKFLGAIIILDTIGGKSRHFKVIEGDAGQYKELTVAMLKDLHAKFC